MNLEDGEYITYKSRRKRAADNLFDSKSKEEENMGDKRELPKGSTMQILNDLARGQQQLVQLLTQFMTNQNNASNNGT